MAEKPDLYYREHTFNSSMAKIKDSDLTESNKAKLIEFIGDIKAKKLSVARMNKYLLYIRKCGEMLGVDFEAATEKDIKRVIITINDRKDYSLHTKHDFSVLVKRFYKWLEGDEVYPKKVRWITTTMTRQEKQSLYPKTNEIPTADDVNNMIDHARNVRDKCFVSMLFDSACRIGELLNVQVKDISVHGEDKAYVTVEGKTGTRKVYIKYSVRYLSAWLNIHPRRNDKDFYESWLFLNNKGRRLGYEAVRKLLKDLKARAGLKAHVKVNPHAFRHAQITELFRLGVNEPVTKKHVGWSNSTRMVEVYSHLTTKDVENAIDLAKRDPNDPAPEPPEPHPLKKQTCGFCGNDNTPTARFCEKCGTAMDKGVMLDEVEAEKEILKYLSKPAVIQAIRDEMKKDKRGPP